MTQGWAGAPWGEPSTALAGPPPLRSPATSATAAYRAEGGRSENFLVLGACTAGVSHRLARRRCEDFYAWAQPDPGRLALLVADGVGSAGRGGEGAEIAVNAACQYLTVTSVGEAGPSANRSSELGRPSSGGWGKEQCLGAVAAASEALVRSGGAAVGELATTIVVALVRLGDKRRDGHGPGEGAEVALARVGDSSAFIVSGTGGWQELFALPAEAPEELGSEGQPADRLISGATAVLPLEGPLGPGGWQGFGGASRKGVLTAGRGAGAPGGVTEATGVEPDVQLAWHGAVELSTAQLGADAALVLVTDGVAEPLRDGPTTVAPRLAELVALGPAGKLGPLDLAMALDFSRRGAYDDRTVLAAWLAGG